jgi:hypothetical protein
MLVKRLIVPVLGLCFIAAAFQNCGGNFIDQFGGHSNGYVYEGRPDIRVGPTDKVVKMVECNNEAQGTNRVFHTQMYYNEQLSSLQSMTINEMSRTGVISSRATSFGSDVFNGFELAKRISVWGVPYDALSLDLSQMKMQLVIRKTVKNELGKSVVAPEGNVNTFDLDCQ